MSATSELLFSYLRGIIYSSQRIELDLDKLDEEFVMLGKGLVYFAHCVAQNNEFTSAISKGDLSVTPPPQENELAAPLKSLQASLKHLTWQTQQVAKGDYKQHVDFMGEFSDAFNTMVKQLADRQEKLENEILAGQKHAKAMEQSNQLLSKLAHYIPEQIFVVSTDTHEILHINDVAKRELDNDPAYITNLISLLPAHESQNVGHYSDVRFTHNDTERYLVVNAYHIEWLERNATALVVNDVSIEKKQMKELEDHAYRDGLTQVYNRFFGMLTLNEWVDNKKRFALVFVDLDNLKYINDNFGHNEGDGYIIRTAGHLQTYSNDAIICRLGGDEFMLLVPDTDFDEAHSRMEEIQYAIQHDKYLLNKDFYYSISLGIVAVGKDNNMSSSDILSIADERMYEHKRVRKMERKNAAAGGR